MEADGCLVTITLGSGGIRYCEVVPGPAVVKDENAVPVASEHYDRILTVVKRISRGLNDL